METPQTNGSFTDYMQLYGHKQLITAPKSTNNSNFGIPTPRFSLFSLSPSTIISIFLYIPATKQTETNHNLHQIRHFFTL